MRTIYVTCFLLLLTSSAPVFAQSTGTPATNVPTEPALPRNPTCNSFLQHSIGSAASMTTLSVHILKDGSFTGLSVLSSSGSAELDNAAIACAAATHAVQKSNGQPVDIDWQAVVPWDSRFPAFVFVPALTICSARNFSLAAIRNEQGAVIFSYVIDSNGNATGVKILRSSGFAHLDAMAANCTQDWHLPIAVHNGEPVPIDKVDRITFSLH